MRLLIGTLLVLAAACGYGVSPARSWDFSAGITTTYDDNILNYSERDLFAFRYRLNPARYALSTTDDLVLSPYLEVFWEPDSTRSNSVRARLEFNRYATNTIRNNLETEIQWRTRPFRRWRLSFTGTYLPSYYVRRYIDDETIVPFPELPRYRDARYRQIKGEASVEWRPAKAWRGQFDYEYGRRDYLELFAERDQDRHALRLSLRPPPLEGVVVARLRGAYGRVLARAWDGDEVGGVPDDPDVSDRRFGGGLTLEWTARRRQPSITLRQAVDYEARRYTTRDTSDSQRFGRSLRETNLDWELAFGLSRHWEVAGSYGIDVQRLTGSLSNIETFTDAASYNRHRLSLKVGWTPRRRSE